MTSAAFHIAGILAWLPFVNPLKLPNGTRLWLVLPLLFCVALVYRVTRARTVADLPRATVTTFLSILAGMVLIAGGAYAAHEIVLRYA